MRGEWRVARGRKDAGLSAGLCERALQMLVTSESARENVVA